MAQRGDPRRAAANSLRGAAISWRSAA